MSWLPASITLGLWSRRPGAPAGERHSHCTELIRAAILESLDGAVTIDAALLARRARNAGDVERLWYLRVDLMTVLASAFGEAVAHGKLREINALFQELLPGSFMCRSAGADTAPGACESP